MEPDDRGRQPDLAAIHPVETSGAIDEPAEPDIVHLAAPHVIIDGRYLRQRCLWCGAILIDYDLSRLAYQTTTPEEQRQPATWAPGTNIGMTSGGHSFDMGRPDRLPERSCAYLDPAVTR
jgi:hypothetical protein